MKSLKSYARNGICTIAVAGMLIGGGCGTDALFLQDYGRDLLVAGLAVALLLNQPAAPADDGGVGQPIPGEQGSEGVQGSPGPPGTDGAAGQDGADGAVGPAGPEGLQGLTGEQGAQGEQGPKGDAGDTGDTGAVGASGQPGADGPEFFDIFIDDFFIAEGTLSGSLVLDVVEIDEPRLGVDTGSGESGAIAYRVAVPQVYQSGNDVTMRMFFNRTGEMDTCFVFQLDARRLRDGRPGPECYGGTVDDEDGLCAEGTRWIRADLNERGTGGDGNEVFFALDLPINTAAGLGLPGDLEVRDFLAFEIKLHPVGGVQDFGVEYQLLGVEFIESAPGTAALEGATVFFPGEEPFCTQADEPTDTGETD